MLRMRREGIGGAGNRKSASSLFIQGGSRQERNTLKNCPGLKPGKQPPWEF